MKFRGTVRQGILRLENPSGFNELLATFEGRPVSLNMSAGREDRSLPQNSWYWGVIVRMIGEHCGYSAEETHDALKQMFLRDRENERDGLVRIKSSTRLDTREFSDYCEQCRKWAAEFLNLYIPDPNEVPIDEVR